MRAARLAAVMLLGLCTVGAAAPSRHKPRTYTVRIEQMRFEPRSLAVSTGDTIVWTNKDLVPHTATSKAGGFDSQTLRISESWSYTATRRGTFEYLCSFHPTMTGTVRVR